MSTVVQICDISDPNIFGPLRWKLIHRLCAEAKSQPQIRSLSQIMPTILATLPCLECRQHALDYYANNPLNRCLDCDHHRTHPGYGRDMCAFLWSYWFHDTVNRRISKEKGIVKVSPSIEEAYALCMSDELTCSANCGAPKYAYY